VPSVRDHKNALLLKPQQDDFEEETLATFQYALLRGIESLFQLEQGEILAEPMPTRDQRKGFLLYEATEGGAGVLTRLVSEPTAFAAVARRALAIMHFGITDEASVPADPAQLADAPNTSCVAACYRCLMSYYNQPDHEIIDRRDEEARRLLVRLARAKTSTVDKTGTTPAPVLTPGEAPNETGRWQAKARSLEVPAWDRTPLDGHPSVPFVWRAHYVAAAFATTPATAMAALEDLGFEVIVFGPEDAWPEAFARLAAALGRKA
jgi:hypothetical protein